MNQKNSAATILAELKDLFGPPPVLRTENPKAYDGIMLRLIESLPDWQSRVVVLSSSVACPHGGSPATVGASARQAAPAGSEKSEKIGDRLAAVARVSLRRSSFGPGCVRSWGRIRPAP